MMAINGYLYGRGITDNKGPIMAMIFALKEMKEQGILKGERREGGREGGREGEKVACSFCRRHLNHLCCLPPSFPVSLPSPFLRRHERRPPPGRGGRSLFRGVPGVGASKLALVPRNGADPAG